MSPEEPLKIWDFDNETLAKAWLEYHRLPVADRKERFGQYFYNRFKIRSLISWPALFYEENNLKAYVMLSELAGAAHAKPKKSDTE